MRYVAIGRVAGVGMALLLFLSICSLSPGAKEVIAAKVMSLTGTANVTKADGTTEALKDTSKPIVLPAAIEMVGPKGSFWISLPSAITGKYNTVSWSLRKGEAVRVSVLKSNRGVKFEYLKGTRKFFLDVNNRENVLLVRSVKGVTSAVMLQNRVTIAEKSSAILTAPMNAYASVRVEPGQVSELEFSYSPVDRYIQFVQVLNQVGTVKVTRAGVTLPVLAGGPAVTEPIGIPSAEKLAFPVAPPEEIDQSPYQPGS